MKKPPDMDKDVREEFNKVHERINSVDDKFNKLLESQDRFIKMVTDLFLGQKCDRHASKINSIDQRLKDVEAVTGRHDLLIGKIIKKR